MNDKEIMDMFETKPITFEGDGKITLSIPENDAVLFYYNKSGDKIPLATYEASIILSPHRYDNHRLFQGIKQKKVYAWYHGTTFLVKNREA